MGEAVTHVYRAHAPPSRRAESPRTFGQRAGLSLMLAATGAFVFVTGPRGRPSVLDATSSVTSITPSSTITVTASLAAAANATEVAGSEAAANITAAGQTSKSNKDETVITLPSQEKSYGDAEFGYSGKRTIVPDEVQYKSPDSATPMFMKPVITYVGGGYQPENLVRAACSAVVPMPVPVVPEMVTPATRQTTTTQFSDTAIAPVGALVEVRYGNGRGVLPQSGVGASPSSNAALKAADRQLDILKYQHWLARYVALTNARHCEFVEGSEDSERETHEVQVEQKRRGHVHVARRPIYASGRNHCVHWGGQGSECYGENPADIPEASPGWDMSGWNFNYHPRDDVSADGESMEPFDWRKGPNVNDEYTGHTADGDPLSALNDWEPPITDGLQDPNHHYRPRVYRYT